MSDAPYGEVRMVLIRGLPGSGKSTYGANLVTAFEQDGKNRAVLIEADDYFMVNGVYMFDHNKIREAHDWCQWRAEQALKHNMMPVVANTFSRLWEMLPYLNMVEDRALVLRCTGNYTSVHCVPDGAIKAMKDRWEPYAREKVV